MQPVGWQDIQDGIVGAVQPDLSTFRGVGGACALYGGSAALFALAIELLAGLRLAAGRRSLTGTVALVQIAMAAVLLVGVNVWSFQHPKRLDLTRNQQFTLPEEVRQQLAQLDPNSETTIVLYQQHRGANDKPDPLELEAERKVVEKVTDLIELFREVGPQFRVEVLDVAEKGYADRLAAVTRDAPELRKAIEAAPQSSIFIRSGKHVQRVGFGSFYRLDRSASQKRDNLVLRSVGPEPIARRIVNVEERASAIGVLVAHERLSSEGPINLFTLAGARKVLERAGFEVHDVILKGPTGEPTADSLEVSKLERLQNDLDELNAEISSLDREVKLIDRLLSTMADGSLDEINRLILAYAEQFNPRFILVRLNDRNRDIIKRLFSNQRDAARESLNLAREEQQSVAKDLSGLSGERIRQLRRLKDLRTRLKRFVDDYDMLLVVRLTSRKTASRLPIRRSTISTSARPKWSASFCVRADRCSPVCATNVPNLGRPGGPPAIKPPDPLESMLAQLGILFGKRTILYNVEKRAFAGREENLLRVSKPLQVPALRIGSGTTNLAERLQQDAFTEIREPLAALGTAAANPLLALPFIRPANPVLAANPVEESLRLADEESGSKLDLKLRFLRPVFIDPLSRSRMTVAPEVLATTSATWNDEQPFSTTLRPVPRFEPPVPEDPDNGTLEAAPTWAIYRRRGGRDQTPA